MGSGDFFHHLPSSTVSSCCFDAYQLSSLEAIHSSGVHNAPFRIETRHREAFQLPSLKFWLVLQIIRTVFVFRHQVTMNSHVMTQLWATMTVTLLLFRPPFASLRSLIVSALTLRHLIHL